MPVAGSPSSSSATELAAATGGGRAKRLPGVLVGEPGKKKLITGLVATPGVV
jgi:hypothetical protein